MGFFNKTTAPGQANRANTQNSTQTHLKIGEIRDNTLVLKNGGVRAILKTSSINFNLKSEQEQNAIIVGYQNFLNSLEFPIQIMVRSKKLDIDDYIEQVKGIGEKQTNKLLQEQTFEYAQYIKRLVEYADIMEKEFYVIVPYEPGRVQASTKIQQFFQRLAPKDSYGEIKRRHAEFNNLKKALEQRKNVVISGLENCGLKVTELNTQEIIQLYYNSYNPSVSRTSKIKDLENSTIDSDRFELNQEKQV